MNPITSTHFKIGGTMPGAVAFLLTLNMSQQGDVSGNGQLGQSTNPPLDMHTTLSGHATSVWDIEGVTQIISLNGYSEGTITPLAYQNVRCTIVIQSNKPNGGLAQLQYRTSASAAWTVLPNLPVSSSALVAA
jgi:hypothetical protein